MNPIFQGGYPAFRIALSGKAGSGKDTIAAFLQNHFGFTPMALADPLKELAAQLGEFPVRWCYTREGKERKVPLMPELCVGQLLQQLGTEVGRQFSDDVWLLKFERQIANLELKRVAVTDCRFENEVSHFLNGRTKPSSHVIYLTRSSQTLLGSRDSNHASESEMDSFVERFKDHPNFHIVDNQRQTVEETEGEVMSIVASALQKHENVSSR